MAKNKVSSFDPNAGDCQYCGGIGSDTQKDAKGQYSAGDDCLFCDGNGDANTYDSKRGRSKS